MAGVGMANLDKQLPLFQLAPAGDTKAIEHVRQAIAGGKHWYIALLEAIGLWSSAEEANNGRVHCYLIDGEAFDWLELAERLCETVDGSLPDNEKMALLFHGEPPLDLTTEEFKQLIGSNKYRQYLNYFYGITVEEALILAVQEEIRKEKRTSGYDNEHDIDNEVYQRTYGDTKTALLNSFRRENDYPQRRSIILTELKEFTYWRFKYRLNHCDKARIASDTKKGLEQLKRQGTNHNFPRKLVTDK
tara:strand:- start:1082 stop:1819 length:738 start_codon:yes stop_codon:yes gene_type:complete